MTSSKTIPYWKINSNIVIHPHLEFDGVFDYDKMRAIVENMKEQLKDKMDIIIIEKNRFRAELNGDWNIVFGIYVKNERTIMASPDMIFCTYIIRSDKYFGKSYACPLENPLSFSSTSINNNFCSIQFNAIENHLINTYNGRHINCFPR